jgi:hypothetical protein
MASKAEKHAQAQRKYMQRVRARASQVPPPRSGAAYDSWRRQHPFAAAEIVRVSMKRC